MWSHDDYNRESPISDAPGVLAKSYLATGYLRVYNFSVYSSKASAQWILMFDASTLPVDTAVPLMAYPIAIQGNVGIYYGRKGRLFRRGIVLCNSTTDTTKTIGAADCFFDVEYDVLPTPADPGSSGGGR